MVVKPTLVMELEFLLLYLTNSMRRFVFVFKIVFCPSNLGIVFCPSNLGYIRINFFPHCALFDL